MQVIFRVDASDSIGTGHVERCLTLADTLCDHGSKCYFIHRLHSGNMAEVIRKRGYRVYELTKKIKGAEIDTLETLDVIGDKCFDWLIVDHYSIDSEWEMKLRAVCKNIAVIDDLANRAHDCDVILDQNYFLEGKMRYDHLVPEHAIRLCGPNYAILDSLYFKARGEIEFKDQRLSQILVYYGGTDISNETARALRVLSRPKFKNIEVNIILGINNPHKLELKAMAAKRRLTNVFGHQRCLTKLMSQADLSLGAGGATTWERCALGLPTIVTAVAANQEVFNQFLDKDGAVCYLGRFDKINDDDLADAIDKMIESPNKLSGMSKRAYTITDALGAQRFVEVLDPTSTSSLSLRATRAEDKYLYFNWVNDNLVRQNAFNVDPITWETHDAWFDNHLMDSNTFLWVMVSPQELPLGQARVEIKDQKAIISYSIDSTFRGRGWGSKLLKLVVSAWKSTGNNTKLIGYVLPENKASHKAFLRAGFINTGAGSNGELCFQLD